MDDFHRDGPKLALIWSNVRTSLLSSGMFLPMFAYFSQRSFFLCLLVRMSLILSGHYGCILCFGGVHITRLLSPVPAGTFFGLPDAFVHVYHRMLLSKEIILVSQ